VRVPLRRASAGFELDVIHAGATPKRMPVRSEISKADSGYASTPSGHPTRRTMNLSLRDRNDRFAIAHISTSRYGAPNFAEGFDVAARNWSR
jgi:hypothetical protein